MSGASGGPYTPYTLAAGIFSVEPGAATQDVAVPLVAVTSGSLGMFPDATIHLSDPQLSKLKQTLRVRLSQQDHCSLDTT